MDIEQLKLILQTVQGVSSGALTVTIIFFLKGFLETLLGYGLVVYIVKKVTTIIRDAVMKTAFHNNLMNEINTSVYLNAEEQRRIIQLVRKGKAAEEVARK